MITFFLGLVVGLLIGRLWRHRPSGLSFHRRGTTWQMMRDLESGSHKHFKPRVK